MVFWSAILNLMGLFSIIVFLISKVRRCSLDDSLKFIWDAIEVEFGLNQKKINFDIRAFIFDVREGLKLVDGATFQKVKEFEDSGKDVVIWRKLASLTEIRFFFPCSPNTKSPIESVIKEIGNQHSIRILDIDWIPAIGSLEAVKVIFDDGIAKSEDINKLLKVKQNKALKKFAPPTDDEDDLL